MWSLLLACGAPEAEPPPPPSEPVEPPVLSTEITGRDLGNPRITVEHCQGTLWSYRGCEDVFPVQGRDWMDFQCRHGTDDARTIACTRWADYLLRGIGGPVMLDEGAGVLESLCTGDDAERTLACVTLARELAFSDVERARPFAERGCDGPGSPVACRDVKLLIERLQTTALNVTAAAGLDDIGPGTACRIHLAPLRGGTCTGRVTCDDQAVYGADDSTFACRSEGGRVVRGGDGQPSSRDHDPTLTFDLIAGTVVVTDDTPAMRLEAEVE